MRKSTLFAALGLLSMAAFAMPVAGEEGGAPREGNAPWRPAGDVGGVRPEGPPPGGVRLIPRPVAERLNLTEDQKTQIAALEKETKEKLEKILTEEQKKLLREARPPRRPDGQGGGAGPRDGEGGPRRGPRDGEGAPKPGPRDGGGPAPEAR